MRKVIALEFMTLDGVIQAPGGTDEDTSGGFKYGGWVFNFFDEFVGKVMNEQMTKPFELLLGRKTYEIFASYWPHHEDDWPGVNNVKKFVASTSLAKADWNNSVILRDNVVDQISQLKKEDGKDFHVYGSANFMQTLLKFDLVDELWLKIFPVTLGPGKKLFMGGTVAAKFALTEYHVSPGGVIIANYKRDGEVKGGSF